MKLSCTKKMDPLESSPIKEGDSSVEMLPMEKEDSPNLVEILYHKYNARLYHFIARLTGSKEEAGDIAHDVYLRVIRHNTRHDMTPSFALLRTIATNIITDRFRKRRFQSHDRHVPIENVELESLESTPEEIVWNRKSLTRIKLVFDGLNQKSREAFILHRFSDMTYEQIGEEMGISRSMVQRHISSVLLELNKKLEMEK